MNEARMVPCDRVIARLWEYIDGELRADVAADVSGHLEMCARCFPQYDFQRAYKEFIGRAGRHPVPPHLRRQIFEALLTEDDGIGGGLPTPNSISRRLLTFFQTLGRTR